MKRVQKKTHHAFSATTWLLLVTLAILMVCGGLWFLRTKKSFTLPPLEETYTVKTLHTFKPEDLQTVTISPLGEEKYTLRYQDGKLFDIENPTLPLRDYFIHDLLTCAEAFVVENTIVDSQKEAISLPAYGLSPATVQATFTYKDGRTLTHLVGNLLPHEKVEHYSMFSGNSNVYTVAPHYYELYNTKHFSIFDVDNPVMKPDLIDKVSIKGKIDFTAEYSLSGWNLTSPFAYPMDGEKMSATLHNLDQLRFSTLVGDVHSLNLADYGLDTPVLSLQVHFAPSIYSGYDENDEMQSFDIPENEISLLFGKDHTQATRYVLYDEKVYTMGKFTSEFLFFDDLIPYLNKTPFDVPTGMLQHITYEGNEKKATYRFSQVEKILPNNEFETDTYGNMLYELYVYSQKEEETRIDTNGFLNWYYLLTSISSVSTLPENYTLPKETLASLSIIDTTKMERRFTFHPYTPVYHALCVDGVPVFCVRASWLSEIENALPQ